MSSEDPLIGKQLGDYEIIDVLGRGGMARVYRGYDKNLERYAAVKVFDAHGFKEDELEEYRVRFQREARAIARLRHPQIVNVYQTGQEGPLNYMAMMFIEGRDLRQILKDHVSLGTHLSRLEVLRIITDIADALDYAHAEGVIHRDVKPSNIMVMSDGRAILTDFGLALNVPDGTIGTTFGTVHYIAPEQAISSAQAVPQSDLYSLGVVLYEMLVGKVPFDDQSAMSVALRHISDPPPPPRLFNPEISVELENLVLKMLEKDPAARCQSGKELVAELEKALNMIDEKDHTRPVALPLEPDTPAAAAVAPAARAKKTPAPVVASEKDPTLVDRSQPQAPNRGGGRTGLYVIGAVALLLVLVGAVLVLGGGLGSGGEATPTRPPATPVAAVASPEVTDTVTATALAEASPTRAVAVGVAASATPTVTDAPRTELPPTARATSTPTVTPIPPTPTPVPPTSTALPLVAEDNPDAQIQLIYDGVSLTVYNRSDAPADLSDIRFVRTPAEGSSLSFLADRWAGGSVPVSRLPAGDCFQVWTFNDSLVDAPSVCQMRQAWRQVSSIREFWISDAPGATFDVMRDDNVLAECAIAAGECLVDVRR